MERSNRRAELADLLRTRRARLSPAHVGLPSGKRRRVKGLRREEVAELANMSTTWYTWLEQGRAVNASVDSLERLASVLRLEGREREHLFLLAGHAAPPAIAESSASLLHLVQQTLDSMNPNPAYVINPRWDVIAWNATAVRIFGDFAAIPKPERNIVWLTFKRATRFSRVFEDWERYARCVLGNFRVDSSAHTDDPAWSELTASLIDASPVFAEWWPNHEIGSTLLDRKEIRHPLAGLLTFQPIHLDVQHPARWKIVAYMPCAGTDTAKRLAKLQKKPPSSLLR